MGLLEDAIREHLDLKRKHGATDEELDRQEAEALGPARRAMAPADQADEESAEQAEGAPAGVAEPGDLEGEAAVAEPPTGEEPLADETDDYEAVGEEALEAPPAEAEDTLEPPVFLRPEDEPAQEPAFPDDAADRAEEPAFPGPEDDRAEEPAFPDEAVEPAESAQAEVGRPAFQDTQESDAAGDTPPRGFPPVEDEGPGDADDELEEDDPDVLEDTPDFLQETPEHDRLWFEQKPPRDFDFD